MERSEICDVAYIPDHVAVIADYFLIVN
jgi:hypothetical protein